MSKIDFMMSVRPDASLQMLNACNTQICSHARQTIWKHSPQTVFRVRGRELKLKAKLPNSSTLDANLATPVSANQPHFASFMHRIEPSFDDDSSSGISSSCAGSSDDHEYDLDITIPFEN